MDSLEKRYLIARKKYISNQFSKLNNKQLEGVMTTQGPLLLLAGAGSGKTTVLINRIANLLRFGTASDTDEIPITLSEEIVSLLEQNIDDSTGKYDSFYTVNPVLPYQIIAITFTNKAANELKERIEKMIGPDAARDIWASTFHSACVKILRRNIERIGFTKDFTIYDTDDTKHVIKECLKTLELDETTFPIRDIISKISKAKDQMIFPDEFEEIANKNNDWRQIRYAKVYRMYVNKLKEANALDFDDIILHTVQLLQNNNDIRTYYQNKFRYVLVDEYQDTNHLQYLLTSLLAGGSHNLCVVGDDDQSIYRFRGANIENILSFEKENRNTRLIKLEQNYRSTQSILDAANQVIEKNKGRKGKTLWTANKQGEKLAIKTVYNEQEEADSVVSQILMNYNKGATWNDHAILYRMNAQSNALEYSLRRNGIPYKIIGGLKFFDRAEIKDVLAYLSIINNPQDDLRLKRIINVPSRKIGTVSVEKATEISNSLSISLFQVIEHAKDYPLLSSCAERMEKFAQLINDLRKSLNNQDLMSFYNHVLEETNYLNLYTGSNDLENETKRENIQELASSLQNYINNCVDNEPSLDGFLDDVALYSDLDATSNNDDTVILMTMHSSKGLEFPYVFIVGMEEGLFPTTMAQTIEDIEEERRLCYVAMTRAKEKLYIYLTKQRMIFGRTSQSQPSRFLGDMHENCYEWFGKSSIKLSQNESGSSYMFDDFSYEKNNTLNNLNHNAIKHIPPKQQQSKMINLQVGDSVTHDAFGDGLVISVRPMANDALIEIVFNEIGTKKLMLKAASSHLTKK